MEQATITVDHFQSICRTCMCNCKSVIWFNVHGTVISENVVADIISKCASILVSKEDALPKQMCQQCLQDLIKCHEFVEKCRRSHQTLLSVLDEKNTTVKSETLETELDEIKQEEVDLGVLKTDLSFDSSFQSQLTASHQNSDVHVHDKEKSSAERQNETNKEWYTCKFCDEKFCKLSGLHFHSCIQKETKCDKHDTFCNKADGLNVKHLHHKYDTTEKRIIPERIDTEEKRSKTGFTNQVIDERIHIEEEYYKCTVCDKSFAKKERMIRHQRTHAGVKPYKCEYCEKSFAEKRQLVRHERTHTGEKPYECAFCGKGFIQKVHMTVHERQHTGEKPFKCGYCPKGFRGKWLQLIHERIHRGEKPHKCAFCGMGFVQKGRMIIHERTHTGEKPFKCDYCLKGFAQKWMQVKHERIHTGEKPHKCGFCGRGFASREGVTVHERTHTGEKPYKCGYCEKSFARGWSRVVHERKHTEEKPQISFGTNSLKKEHKQKHNERIHAGKNSRYCGYVENGVTDRKP